MNKKLKEFLCFGWHKATIIDVYGFDGCNIYAICRNCKKEIMQDSQGNWF